MVKEPTGQLVAIAFSCVSPRLEPYVTVSARRLGGNVAVIYAEYIDYVSTR